MSEKKNSHTYKINDKLTFIVTPVYKEDKGETLYSILLNIMKAEFAEAA